VLSFLIDEDLPRSLAGALRGHGFDAVDVRDVGLRAASDTLVFNRAVGEQRVLLSGDLGFGNIRRFPLGSHSGIGVVRYPNEASPQTVIAAVIDAVDNVDEARLRGALMIIEPGRVRVRPPR
jgi:predicted nuclease of predicted toxin-antitoxin system